MKKLLCFLLSFEMLFSFSSAFAENSNTLSKSSTISFTNSNSLEDDIFAYEEGKTFKNSTIATDKYMKIVTNIYSKSNNLVLAGPWTI